MTTTSEPFQLFDALPQHIEDALRASIQRFGVLVPITVDQHGQVLDGNHRKRIADELRVPYDRLVRACESDAERREIARTLNADRRQLTEEQRREVATELRKEGHSLRAIGGALGISHEQVRQDLSTVNDLTVPDRVKGLDGKSRPARRPQVIARDDREQRRAQSALEVIPDAAIRGASIDTKRAERIAREAAAEQRRAEPVEPVTASGGIDIRHGDFRQVLADLSDVDAIITDPPYPREFIPLFADLSAFAAKVLRPGGILAVMTGQYHLPDYIAELGRYMRYRWTGAYITTGTHTCIHSARVATAWKPILVYQRADAPEMPWFLDYFASADDDKRHHHWGQSESGIAAIVEGLTEPGALVADPFLGGGTTAVVCRDLGRRAIGCDIDAAAVETARERLS